jgi:hypothetical protein
MEDLFVERFEGASYGWLGEYVRRVGLVRKLRETRDLVRRPARHDMAWPGDQSRNAQPAFKQFGLSSGERPSVGKSLPATVAREKLLEHFTRALSSEWVLLLGTYWAERAPRANLSRYPNSCSICIRRSASFSITCGSLLDPICTTTSHNR